MFSYEVCPDQNAPTGPDEFFPDDICREKFVIGGVSKSETQPDQAVLLTTPKSSAIPLLFPLVMEGKDVAIATEGKIELDAEILIVVKKEKRNW